MISIILKIVKRIWRDRWVFRSIPYTIFFNFHYLPFRQALFLPIWLYKPTFMKCGGTVKISKNGGVKPGMIRLGSPRVSIYPNTGIVWEHRGNIIFGGSANIGNNSFVSTGKESITQFGYSFDATTSLKLVSYHRIKFGNHCTIGWDTLIMDTDLHVLTRKDGSKSKGYGEIIIGDNNWIANNCKILKNTKTNNNTVLAANTVVSRSCLDFPEYSVLGNKREVIVVSHGYLRPGDNKIHY